MLTKANIRKILLSQRNIRNLLQIIFDMQYLLSSNVDHIVSEIIIFTIALVKKHFFKSMIISEIFFHQPLIYQLDLKWAQGGRNPVYCLTTWDESSCVRILNPKPEIHLYACPPHFMHFQKGQSLEVIAENVHLYLLHFINALTRHFDSKGVFQVQKDYRFVFGR